MVKEEEHKIEPVVYALSVPKGHIKSMVVIKQIVSLILNVNLLVNVGVSSQMLKRQRN